MVAGGRKFSDERETELEGGLVRGRARWRREYYVILELEVERCVVSTVVSNSELSRAAARCQQSAVRAEFKLQFIPIYLLGNIDHSHDRKNEQ